MEGISLPHGRLKTLAALCLPNILHTWPHDSFQLIRLSISRSLDCFTSNFSKTVCDAAKVTID